MWVRWLSKISWWILWFSLCDVYVLDIISLISSIWRMLCFGFRRFSLSTFHVTFQVPFIFCRIFNASKWKMLTLTRPSTKINLLTHESWETIVGLQHIGTHTQMLSASESSSPPGFCLKHMMHESCTRIFRVPHTSHAHPPPSPAQLVIHFAKGRYTQICCISVCYMYF